MDAANVRIPIDDLYENADRLRLMHPLSLSARDLLSNARMLENLSTGIQSRYAHRVVVKTALSTRFLELFVAEDRDLVRGFFRFRLEPDVFGSNASFQSVSAVTLIDPFKHAQFFEDMNAMGRALLSSMNKTHGLFLLEVGSQYAYNVDFEFEDLDRWKISKINGGTGYRTAIS